MWDVSLDVHLPSMQINFLPSPDLESLVPTSSTVIKKAKSRILDKDGHGRNRLSHTSPPLYLAKSKRPAPTDLDGVGAPNRLPAGQQTVSRRQRSLNTKGKSQAQPRHCALFTRIVWSVRRVWIWKQLVKVDALVVLGWGPTFLFLFFFFLK